MIVKHYPEGKRGFVMINVLFLGQNTYLKSATKYRYVLLSILTGHYFAC